MFSLNRVREKIWHLHFETSYDLTMHFLRYQEYYESPKFMKKSVQLVDLMDWYAKTLGKGVFTYPRDWSGFNLPGSEIFDLHNKGIEDINRYDRLMFSIAELIRSKDNSDEFYIIGTSDDDEDLNDTFNHELCHALFYTEEKYKELMINDVSKLPKKEKALIFRKLKKAGYCKEFFIDETQAYMATMLDTDFETPEIEALRGPFIKTFNKFAKGIRKRVKKQ